MTKEPNAVTKVLEIRTIGKDTVKISEIAVRAHRGRYTPDTAYFVSLNGRGKKFDGKNTFKAWMRARDCYTATCEELEKRAWNALHTDCTPIQ